MFFRTRSRVLETLRGVLDTLRIHRAHLVVHDLGGPWGLVWAASSPARLASLTLIGIGALPGYRAPHLTGGPLQSYV